jgi:hypothetical protein
LNSFELEQKVRAFVETRVDDLSHTPTSFGDMFTPDAVSLLKEKAGEQIEPITHHLAEIAAAGANAQSDRALIKREVP